MKNILVTGSKGNVGKYVVKFLNEYNFLKAIQTTSKIKDLNENKELIYFDFTNQNTFDVLSNIDYIFLMRPPHMGNPEDFYPFINFAKQKNIKFIIFLSLMGIENNTTPPHYKIEKYIQNSGIPYCFIRFF